MGVGVDVGTEVLALELLREELLPVGVIPWPWLVDDIDDERSLLTSPLQRSQQRRRHSQKGYGRRLNVG